MRRDDALGYAGVGLLVLVAVLAILRGLCCCRRRRRRHEETAARIVTTTHQTESIYPYPHRPPYTVPGPVHPALAHPNYGATALNTGPYPPYGVHNTNVTPHMQAGAPYPHAGAPNVYTAVQYPYAGASSARSGASPYVGAPYTGVSNPHVFDGKQYECARSAAASTYPVAATAPPPYSDDRRGEAYNTQAAYNPSYQQ